jgi:hypothetical protein
VGVASHGGFKRRTCSTEALGTHGDGALHRCDAAAAKFVTNTKSRPRANSAVDVVGNGIADTRNGVANLLLRETRALNTAVATGDHDVTGPGLGSSAALLGAYSPVRPSGGRAVDRAVMRVTGLRL